MCVRKISAYIRTIVNIQKTKSCCAYISSLQNKQLVYEAIHALPDAVGDLPDNNLGNELNRNCKQS